MLELPVCRATRFVLVGPHYPENVGAAARAMKTMGLRHLILVQPGRLARPEHPMARKMAVKAWDVLENATLLPSVSEALRGVDVTFATTSRRGQRGTYSCREAATIAQREAAAGKQLAVLFGNEKTGLTRHDLALVQYGLRIPMAAQQPSLNLAQCCQVVGYEWFSVGLEQRRSGTSQDAAPNPGLAATHPPSRSP